MGRGVQKRHVRKTVKLIKRVSDLAFYLSFTAKQIHT